ncbi:hypothetical protein [Salana multivorans]
MGLERVPRRHARGKPSDGVDRDLTLTVQQGETRELRGSRGAPGQGCTIGLGGAGGLGCTFGLGRAVSPGGAIGRDGIVRPWRSRGVCGAVRACGTVDPRSIPGPRIAPGPGSILTARIAPGPGGAVGLLRVGVGLRRCGDRGHGSTVEAGSDIYEAARTEAT